MTLLKVCFDDSMYSMYFDSLGGTSDGKDNSEYYNGENVQMQKLTNFRCN